MELSIFLTYFEPYKTQLQVLGAVWLRAEAVDDKCETWPWKRGRRVYTVRNVEVDMQEWTGRETDWMAGFSHAIDFNIPQKIMLTHNFHNDCFYFFKKETFRFWPFYRKELF